LKLLATLFVELGDVDEQPFSDGEEALMSGSNK
jgi:hypothetical protein